MIIPLNDRVIVEKIDEDKTLESGIILTQNQDKYTSKGKVVAVGPGKKDEHGNHTGTDVTEGDVVLFGTGIGQKVRIEGKELWILREDDIYCVVQ